MRRKTTRRTWIKIRTRTRTRIRTRPSSLDRSDGIRSAAAVARSLSGSSSGNAMGWALVWAPVADVGFKPLEPDWDTMSPRLAVAAGLALAVGIGCLGLWVVRHPQAAFCLTLSCLALP